MHVFLIYIRDPQFHTLASEPRAENGKINIIASPPLGIMTLSAVLKQAGHECTMFDQANPETPNKVIIEKIQKEKPDIVGLSFLSTTSYPHAKTLARDIRTANIKVPLAFGGVFASLNAKEIKTQCPDVDFICRGDGEELILDLLKNLNNLASVKGLTWTKNGQIINNPDRELNFDLDQWPFPDRESLSLEFVEAMPLDVPVVLSKKRFTTMQTSRGCPWACVYCNIPILTKKKWRPRSAQHIINELKHLTDLGYGAVYFVDDNFLLQPERIEEICKGIQDNNLTIEWGCEGRVDSTAQHLFPTMVKANCKSMMFGIESGSQNVLNRLNKKQTLAKIKSAVIDSKRAGIERVHGFFVVGTPDEKIEDIKATFDFASKLPLDTFNFNRLCVYRTTPLWDEYTKRGLIDDKADWYKYFKCSDIDPTCLPSEVINKQRKIGFCRLFIHKIIYFPIQTIRLLYLFTRYMKFRSIFYIIVKPFLKSKPESK
ncbi:MAG: radical SAM protein [Candidatus Ancaeobacter aquaticus]|nr:radical SAM protein [Candidatus Ancaeobacter aquaticus]